MRIWLDPDKLSQLQPDARRRHRGDPGAERAGRRRAARRPARACRASSSMPPITAQGRLHDAGAVPRHRAARQPRRLGACAWAMWRASSSAARATTSRRATTASRRAASASGWHRAPMRWTPPTRSRRASRELRGVLPAGPEGSILDTTPLRAHLDPRGRQDAVRGGRAGVAGHVPVPAELCAPR